jgi:hypothetical protein
MTSTAWQLYDRLFRHVSFRLFKMQRSILPTSQSSSGRIRGCSRGWGLGRDPVTCLRSCSMRWSSFIYVCSSHDLLRQRRQDLVPLRCVERGDPCGVLESGLELGHGGAGAHEGGHDALRGGGRLSEDGGTHEGCHCCDGSCAGARRPSVRSPGRCSSTVDSR